MTTTEPTRTAAHPAASDAAASPPSASVPDSSIRAFAPARRLTRVLAGAFGGLPPAFWFLWAGMLVNRLGMFVEPFLVLYLTGVRGLSPAQAGLLLAAWGAGALVSPILGGALADRVGRRATMAGGLFAAAMALLALGAAREPAVIAVTAFAVGVVGDLYRPASSALVADVVVRERRPAAYGLLYWAINLGFSVAAVAGGWLADHGYGLLFVIDAATCAGFAGLILVGIRKDTRPPRRPAGPQRPEAGDTVPKSGYLAALRDPLVLALVLLTLLYATVYMQAYTTLPLAIRDAGLSAADYGTVIALNGVLVVVFQPFAAPLLLRFDRMKVLAVSALLVAIGFASTGLASTLPVFAATIMLWTVGEIGVAGFGQALVADLAPPESRGRYQGLFGFGFGAAAMTGPLVGATVYEVFGPAALWTGCLLAGVVLAAGYLALAPAVARRRAARD